MGASFARFGRVMGRCVQQRSLVHALGFLAGDLAGWSRNELASDAVPRDAERGVLERIGGVYPVIRSLDACVSLVDLVTNTFGAVMGAVIGWPLARWIWPIVSVRIRQLLLFVRPVAACVPRGRDGRGVCWSLLRQIG